MKMLSLPTTLKTALIATALVAAPNVFAQTYIGVSGGISLKNDSKNKGTFTGAVPATTVAPLYPAIPSGTTLGWTTEFDKGLNVNAQIGHRFEGGLRVEGEVSYTRNGVKTHRGVSVGGANIDAVDASVLTRGALVGSSVGAVVNSGIGKTNSLGLFANAFYDFNSAGKFQPYLGAGAGLSRNKVDYRPSNIDVGQGKQTKFAYQLTAGATYKISDSFELFGQYRFRDNGETKVALDLLPADLKVEGKQSIFALGLRIPFGSN